MREADCPFCAEPLQHDIYVLNYTPIDEAYHSDPRSTGVSHVEAVRQLLQGLTQAIHNFALRLGIEERLRVAMCSDHGSTLIPDDAPNVIDAKFIAKRVSDAHNRYASLTDHQFANLPESLRSHCYVFKKDVFDLDAHYLAAREYYCLRNDSHASYVHGGLSPEETIVPYFVFSRQTVTVKPPNVVLKQNVFRYSVRSRVQLEVTNTNEYSLERVRVEIVSPTGASNAYAHHGGIASVSVTTIILDDVRFREQDEEIKQIVVELSYDCAGERRSDEHSFVVSMRRIQTSTFDFGIR